jgi:hypothetical protein
MNTIENFYGKMPTENQVAQFLISYESANQDMRKNEEYRMNNYFNCIDDYSWGGLCDKAANEAYRKRTLLKSNLEQQLKNGAFVEVIEISVLCDMLGNIVSDKIVNGKYGECWIIKNEGSVSFVGVAKKQSTYNKKGFKAMTRFVEVEYYYTTSGNIISRILSERIEESLKEYQTTYAPKELYFAN